jgi:hypothetical protein
MANKRSLILSGGMPAEITSADTLLTPGGHLDNHPTNGVGYTVGAGGAATQATNKSTGVTIDRPSGRVTMNAASLAANTTVSFLVTCATDTPNVAIVSNGTAAAGAYLAWVSTVGNGSFRISVRNMTAGALADAIQINYTIVKGAIT